MNIVANRLSLSVPIGVNFHVEINDFNIYRGVHLGSVQLFNLLYENHAKSKFSFRSRNTKLKIT